MLNGHNIEIAGATLRYVNSRLCQMARSLPSSALCQVIMLSRGAPIHLRIMLSQS